MHTRRENIEIPKSRLSSGTDTSTDSSNAVVQIPIRIVAMTIVQIQVQNSFYLLRKSM